MQTLDQVVIRPARDDELRAVGALTRTAYAHAGLGDESYLAHVADAVTRAQRSLLLVAERAGRLVGTVTLAAAGTAFADIARPGEFEFRMLAVDPAATGGGTATALVGACASQAVAAGVGRLVCSVEDRNAAALRLYDHLGFTREPARDRSPVPGVRLLVLERELPGRSGV